MEIPFDELWTPDEASFHLTGTSDLEPNIRSAILADKLTAERREYNRIPRTLSMSEQVDEAVREAIYGTSAKTEPTKIHEYRIKPTDAVEWAIAAGVDIRPECLSRYHELTKPKKRATRSGPREATLYAVIAAMAKTLGYTPGKSLKAGQGKLKAIMVNTNLTEKTIREVIEQALHHHEDK